MELSHKQGHILFQCGLLPQGSFTSSDQAVDGPFSVLARYGPFEGPHDMDLPSSQSARSIEPRPAGSVYKAAIWSTRDSVLNASLNYVYNRAPLPVQISNDRQCSDPTGRPLIHLRNQQDPTGSKPSTAGRPEWPARLAAEAIPVFWQTSLCTSSTVFSAVNRDRTLPFVTPH
jgi:hypothetical protein